LKKIFASLILAVIVCNFAFAETIFYEDYSFYGKLVTDIRLNKIEKQQQIQVTFPSFLPSKIPFILNGHAYYKEIDDKPVIMLELDQLSIGAQRHIPVKILITAINGKNIKGAIIAKDNRYLKSFKYVNGYTKDLLAFPINRYKLNPTLGKPTANTYIMFLEPVYFFLAVVWGALSPVTSVLTLDEDSPDIHRGTIFEFEFLQELSRKDLEKVVEPECL